MYIDGKRNKAVKHDYDRQSAGLEGVSSEMACQENNCPSPTAETQTRLEEDDEGVSKRFSSFAIQFSKILQRAAKDGDQWVALRLVELLTDTWSGLNILRQYIKSVADCQDVTTKNTRELMKDDGICGIKLKSSNRKKDGCGTVHRDNLIGVLQKQIDIRGKVYTVFRPGSGNVFSSYALPSVSTEYI